MAHKRIALIKHDPEIVALIKDTDHKVLAQWAIECFERGRILLKTEYPEQDIVTHAITTLRLWMEDGISMWEARKYCWVILEAARNIEARDKVACQVLRACSHMLATCHVPSHAEGAGMYILSALQYANQDCEDVSVLIHKEHQWQIMRLKALRKYKLIEES